MKSDTKGMKIFIDKKTGEFYLVATKEGATLTGYISEPLFNYYNVPEPFHSIFTGQLVVSGINTFEMGSARGAINSIINNNNGEVVNNEEAVKPTLFPEGEQDAQYFYKDLSFGYFDPEAYEAGEIKPPRDIKKNKGPRKRWWKEQNLYAATKAEERELLGKEGGDAVDELQQKEFPVNNEEAGGTGAIITPPPEDEANEEGKGTDDKDGESVPDDEKEDRPDTAVGVNQAKQMKIGAGNQYCTLAEHPSSYIIAWHNEQTKGYSTCATPPDEDGRSLFLIFPGERQAKKAIVLLNENPYYEKLLADFTVYPMTVIHTKHWHISAVRVKNVYSYLEGLNAVVGTG